MKIIHWITPLEKSLIDFSFEEVLSAVSSLKGENSLNFCLADTGITHTFSKYYPKIPKKSILLLNLPNSDQFLGVFLAGIAKDCQIFLGNPKWKKKEWGVVFDLIKPCAIADHRGLIILSRDESETGGKIMIPTGGSSGKIRFVEHNLQTLSASVKGFCDYFEEKIVNCFCVLPLYHVSGLMQLMRTFLTGGQLIPYSYKALEMAWKHQDLQTLKQLKTFPQQNYFLSLVPTQLQRLLNFGAGKWLSEFKAVLLGGAPPWKSLLETARAFKIPLALTYGMTETASQVVTLKPRDFLRGNNSVGQVLPHGKLWLTGEQGERLGAKEVGIVTIKSQSLGFGYYPDSDWDREAFVTDDLGYFDAAGYLYLVGRRSRKIITGGENVFPDEVEAAILSTGLVKDVYVFGLADQNWGEVVSAIYVPKHSAIAINKIKKQLQASLSAYKIPKQWFAIAEIPRNEQGKIELNSIF